MAIIRAEACHSSAYESHGVRISARFISVYLPMRSEKDLIKKSKKFSFCLKYTESFKTVLTLHFLGKLKDPGVRYHEVQPSRTMDSGVSPRDSACIENHENLRVLRNTAWFYQI